MQGFMKSAMATSLAILCTAALAAPASWYQWRSKIDGTIVCTQTSPGPGWTKLPTPYLDARCKVPGSGA